MSASRTYLHCEWVSPPSVCLSNWLSWSERRGCSVWNRRSDLPHWMRHEINSLQPGYNYWCCWQRKMQKWVGFWSFGNDIFYIKKPAPTLHWPQPSPTPLTYTLSPPLTYIFTYTPPSPSPLTYSLTYTYTYTLHSPLVYTPYSPSLTLQPYLHVTPHPLPIYPTLSPHLHPHTSPPPYALHSLPTLHTSPLTCIPHSDSKSWL